MIGINLAEQVSHVRAKVMSREEISETPALTRLRNDHRPNSSNGMLINKCGEHLVCIYRKGLERIVFDLEQQLIQVVWVITGRYDGNPLPWKATKINTLMSCIRIRQPEHLVTGAGRLWLQSIRKQNVINIKYGNVSL